MTRHQRSGHDAARGAQGLDASRLWRIADALGVSLGVLLCLEPLPLTRSRTRTGYRW
jgi:pyrroloquinoline quinone (PQQ) biosynthesis protein C